VASNAERSGVLHPEHALQTRADFATAEKIQAAQMSEPTTSSGAARLCDLWNRMNNGGMMLLLP
jgi:hypothetical protein